MAKPMKFLSSRKFGSRYGKRIRDLHGKYEEMQRMKYKCPYCNKVNVRRVSAGIWECASCNVKFTGKAYQI